MHCIALCDTRNKIEAEQIQCMTSFLQEQWIYLDISCMSSWENYIVFLYWIGLYNVPIIAEETIGPG